jgi:hypothetical protein
LLTSEDVISGHPEPGLRWWSAASSSGNTETITCGNELAIVPPTGYEPVLNRGGISWSV